VWKGMVGVLLECVRGAGRGLKIIGDAMSSGIRDPRFRDPCIRG